MQSVAPFSIKIAARWPLLRNGLTHNWGYHREEANVMSYLTFLGGIFLAGVIAFAFGFLYNRFEQRKTN